MTCPKRGTSLATEIEVRIDEYTFSQAPVRTTFVAVGDLGVVTDRHDGHTSRFKRQREVFEVGWVDNRQRRGLMGTASRNEI